MHLLQFYLTISVNFPFSNSILQSLYGQLMVTFYPSLIVTFIFFFFFFNDTATTEIYTLSLHDALPISFVARCDLQAHGGNFYCDKRDRKSTRLNSSHTVISYAVFCLKKKKKKNHDFMIKKKTKKNQKNNPKSALN